jgi:hypothetical protein
MSLSYNTDRWSGAHSTGLTFLLTRWYLREEKEEGPK